MFLPVLLVCTAGACANAVPPPRTDAAPPTTAAAPVLNNSLRETGCPGRSTPDSSSYGLIDMPVSLLRMGGVSARLREVSRLFRGNRRDPRVRDPPTLAGGVRVDGRARVG